MTYDRVRCCDCRHFKPDTIGSGQGIGDCAIGDPTMPENEVHMEYRGHMPAGHRIRYFGILNNKRALWPRVERQCPGFKDAASP